MVSTHPENRCSTRLIQVAVALLVTATAFMHVGQLLAQQPDASPQPSTTPVDRLKTFGTMGKAVYPFTEGSKTEAELFGHEGNDRPLRRTGGTPNPQRRTPDLEGPADDVHHVRVDIPVVAGR